MEIERKGTYLHQTDSQHFSNLLTEDHDNKLNDYQKLLLSQQLKANNVKGGKGMRWHPTIIKWCLYLQSKSPKCFKTLRESGFIKLPSERTLYDYSHYVKSEFHV